MRSKRVLMALLGLGLLHSIATAHVPVVDMNEEEAPLVADASPVEREIDSPRTSSARSFNDLERLRDQINALQGQIEQQNHSIEQLQTQQKTFYADLDRRLSGLEHPNEQRPSSDRSSSERPSSPHKKVSRLEHPAKTSKRRSARA